MPKRKPLNQAELESEYEACVKALVKSNFNRTRAAQTLNITRRTLYNKLKYFEKVGLHKIEEVA